MIADGCHALRDGDAGQAAALIEDRLTDRSHALRDGDAGQAAALHEGIIADGCHALRDVHSGQAAALIECLFSYAGQCVWKLDLHQVGAGFSTINRCIEGIVHQLRQPGNTTQVKTHPSVWRTAPECHQCRSYLILHLTRTQVARHRHCMRPRPAQALDVVHHRGGRDVRPLGVEGDGSTIVNWKVGCTLSIPV